MSLITNYILFFTLCHLLHLTHRHPSVSAAGAAVAGSGKWDLLLNNTGIPVMHMQLLHNDKVIMFDRTDISGSNISLPSGVPCRLPQPPDDTFTAPDCTAHSVEYDVLSNTLRPLTLLTNVWCSSAAVSPAGTLVQTGGNGLGGRIVRVFEPCDDSTCDWAEENYVLGKPRWYASNHVLPDGRQIIVGGRRAFSYEFYPKGGPGGDGLYKLPFLAQTNEPRIENNLYPFVFLNVDGHLFIYANNKSILLDYTNNVVVRTYPDIPGGHPRNYPSTGSAILLPLKDLDGPNTKAEVLICGGAPKGAFENAKKKILVDALNTCGRIRITDPNPVWEMEQLPTGRVMSDMVMLPNGHVLIINGAGVGVAGWDAGREPALHPFLYRPDERAGFRVKILHPSGIPRMYHSSAVLTRDGRVIVTGSNPHNFYKFTNVLFPTELRLESFSPSYLDPKYAGLRPRVVSPGNKSKYGYGQKGSAQFTVSRPIDTNLIMVTMVSPSFNTHSFSMNQRLLVLNIGEVKQVGADTYGFEFVTPGSGHLAPPGYYLLFVVYKDIPSEGVWVHIQ